jgi:lipoprotein-anchoring transpeptidase ErfK/SrfK
MNAPNQYIKTTVLSIFGLICTSAGASNNLWKSGLNNGQQAQSNNRSAIAMNSGENAARSSDLSVQTSTKRKGLLSALFGKRDKSAVADRRSRQRTSNASSTTNTRATARYRVREEPAAAAPARGNSRSEAKPERKKGGLLAALFKKRPDRDRRTASRSTRSGSTTAPAPYVPRIEYNSSVLAQSDRGNTRLVIDISRQTAFLLVDEQIGLETAISSARSGKYTPRGTFRVTERVRSGKVSTLYHVVMPYWQRLNSTVYGVHAGYLPGYPASAGCVRLPSEAAAVIYDHLSSGASVTILDSWTGA